MIPDYLIRKTKRHTLIIVIMWLALLLILTSCGTNQEMEYAWQYSRNADYHLDLEKIQDNQRKTTRTEQITVAILDVGIDTACAAIKDRLWYNAEEAINGIDDDNNGYIDDCYGWNFVEDTPDISCTENSHGTSIAGIIVSNDKRCPGIAQSANVNLMILKVLKDDGQSDDINLVIDAIKYAEKNGATICNLSFSTEMYDQRLKDTIDSSTMLFVTSAGNGELKGRNIDKEPVYPAGYDSNNIITVGAADRWGSLSLSSNYGFKSVDILAPGEGIFVFLNDQRIDFRSGTSYAAAFVAGVAAICLSINEDSIEEVKNRILNNSWKKPEISEVVNSKGVLSPNF